MGYYDILVICGNFCGLLIIKIMMILKTFGKHFVVSFFQVCELGERTTAGFDSFNDTFFQCEWYLFPIELQQMLLIMIANAQQPVIIKGFANTLCARESFAKVNKNLIKLK